MTLVARWSPGLGTLSPLAAKNTWTGKGGSKQD